MKGNGVEGNAGQTPRNVEFAIGFLKDFLMGRRMRIDVVRERCEQMGISSVVLGVAIQKAGVQIERRIEGARSRFYYSLK